MASKSRYPIYIISKGRTDSVLTARLFDKESIPYTILVEPQEKSEYESNGYRGKIESLPFQNLGLGSYPARNHAWHLSKSLGYSHHWIFDDNIQGWRKWVNGKRIICDSISSAMRFVEDEQLRSNADILGFEEYNMCRSIPKRPFKNNCHVYSAMLIKNALPYRWRLKYNEDVDLCLQVLHNGGTTASCVYYLADKVSTSVKMKGGNQTELYKGNDPKKKLLKAKMLEAVWPQYAKTVIRFNRPHHYVDWKVFQKKTTLQR
jgi:hypothetical protein